MNDEEFMQIALELAQSANPSPNPKVGALIVKDGKVVAKGYHREAGMPHAEIEAINCAKPDDLRGATLYVTLEPCSHYGKTPPCTNAIISCGISKVVFGASDANPKVQGREILERAGLEVIGGVLEKESREMNQYYFFAMQNSRPHVTLKWAMSIDGKIATKTGNSKWITSKEARARARQARSSCDAVVVGANTVIADNPELSGPKYKVVLDSNLRIPLNAKIFQNNNAIIVCSKGADRQKKEIVGTKAKVLELDSTSVKNVLFALRKCGINSVFVEGGGETLARFFQAKLFDRVIVYISPKIIGGKDAITPVGGQGLENVPALPVLSLDSISRIGDDLEVIYGKRKKFD